MPGRWDRDRLEQVFSNLVGNALNYGLSTTAVRIECSEEGDQVRVEVHNQGPPIPPELVKQIFNPFRRGLRDSRKTATAGLGLGLYISQQIVMAHGGDIEVQSNESDGTTFRVTLPFSFARQSPPAVV